MAKDKKDFVEDEQSKEPQFSEIKETIIDENIPEEGKEKKKKKFRDLFKSKEDDEEDNDKKDGTSTLSKEDRERLKSEMLEELLNKANSNKENKKWE